MLGRVQSSSCVIVAAVVTATSLLCACRKPLPADVVVSIRGHQDVVITDDGGLVPVFFKGRVGLCLQTPGTLDTSQWVAEIRVNGRPAESRPVHPVARLGSTLCFEAALPTGASEGPDLEICGTITDTYDGSSYQLPGRPVRFLSDAAPYRKLQESLVTMLNERSGQSLEELVAALDGLGKEARARGFPMFSVQTDLIVLFFLSLEGTDESFELARQRAARLPAWLEQAGAESLGGVAGYEQARLARLSGDNWTAWQLLNRAAERHHRIADPKRLLMTLLQSEIIAEAGAMQEACRRIRTAIADCETVPCDAGYLPMLPSYLAWLIMLDPEATAEDLEQAEQHLAASLQVDSETTEAVDPFEGANRFINLAYLQGVRLGRDPDLALAEARSLLKTQQVGHLRRRTLEAWTDLVEGLAALRAGRLDRAQTLCAAIADLDEYPELAARALSCSAEVARRQGRPDSARTALGRALELHRFSSRRLSELRILLGPGYTADDYYLAARLEIEEGDPERAWALLDELDSLLASEDRRHRCRQRATDPEVMAQWQRIDTEIKELLGQLISFEATSTAARTQPLDTRARQLDTVRRTLTERLQELWWSWPGCGQTAQPTTDPQQGFRAFALEDEIILLHSTVQGRVSLVRRTPFPRVELSRLVGRVAGVIEGRSLDTEGWRDLVRPLAAALVPDLESLGSLTVFTLHGLLQGVPLGALPAGDGWLADFTTVAVRPAGVRPATADQGVLGASPLFVVDPLRNLRSGPQLLEVYQDLFPRGSFLAGPTATAPQLGAGLAQCSWLHIDAHGLYDPAFPELSSLSLADGPLSLMELAELPLPVSFANLSGCQTGRWPTLAGSGHYGMAGVLARRGVRWVGASRAILDDRLARDFNSALYRAVAGGMSLPDAWSRALRQVRQEHSPPVWAALLLVQGGQGSEG